MDSHHAFPLLRRATSDIGAEAYAVGGYVRDWMLGIPSHDLDVVVGGGRALDLARRYAELTGAPPPVCFPHFGTAHVSCSPDMHGSVEVEFADARSESYGADSRKPFVRPASVEEDLLRRDFTVNAMLMDFDGRVRDDLPTVLQGHRDLAMHVLRTPVDPLVTFADDPLRMVRAARFASQLGFSLDRHVLLAMLGMAGRMRPPKVSVERVMVELRKLLLGRHPAEGLEVMRQGGLLDVVLPEMAATVGVGQGRHHLYDVWGHTLRVVEGVAAEPVLRLAALLHDVGKPPTADGVGHFHKHEDVGARMARAALVRLRFPLTEAAAVARLVRLHMRPVLYRESDRDAAVRRLLRDAGDLLPFLMALTRADQDASAHPAGAAQDDLERRLEEVRVRDAARLDKLPLTGGDVMRVRGLDPGPEVGRLLRLLGEMVIEGDLPAERGALLEALATL